MPIAVGIKVKVLLDLRDNAAGGLYIPDEQVVSGLMSG